MKKLLSLAAFILIAITLNAQAIVLTSGSLAPLKGEKVLGFEFTYHEMQVGKMTEEEYINKKVNDYNDKEQGRGDMWRANWVNDRTERYEPKFIELFDKYMADKSIRAGQEGANYVIVLNTDFTEPGFNVGVVRKNAAIDLTGRIIKIDTDEVIATFRIKNASANNFWGTDFDSGYRIQETYGKAGREFAKFLIKKGKL